MERPLVTAVTHSTYDARITLTQLPDRPGVAGRVMTALAAANVNVDMIIQNEPESEGHGADMSFTVPRDDVHTSLVALEPLRGELGIGEIAADEHMGKVSLVGAGMRSHPGVAAKAIGAARTVAGISTVGPLAALALAMAFFSLKSGQFLCRRAHEQPDFPVAGVVAERNRMPVVRPDSPLGTQDQKLFAQELGRVPTHPGVL